MTRTKMIRALFCGTIIIAALTLMAACSSVPTPKPSKEVCLTCQIPNQAAVTPPQEQPSKASSSSPTSLPLIPGPGVSVVKSTRASRFSSTGRGTMWSQPGNFQAAGLAGRSGLCGSGGKRFYPHCTLPCQCRGHVSVYRSDRQALRLEQNQWINERRHPFKTARAAAEYLSFLYDTFGSWPLALAGYNCGEKAVQAALDQSGLRIFRDIAQHGYLPAETRDYVPKVYATIKIARNSKQYGFQFDPQHYTPKHGTVPVPGGVKLAWLEKQTGVSESSLRTCNPELCQAATPPGASPYDLCVPIGTKESVQTALATCPLPPPEEQPAPKPLLVKNEEKPAAKSLLRTWLKPGALPRLRPAVTPSNPVIPGSALPGSTNVRSMPWRPLTL